MTTNATDLALAQSFLSNLKECPYQAKYNHMEQLRKSLLFYSIFVPEKEIDVMGELTKRIKRAAIQIEMDSKAAYDTFNKNIYTVEALKALTAQEVELVHTVHEITFQDFVDKFGAVSVIG